MYFSVGKWVEETLILGMTDIILTNKASQYGRRPLSLCKQTFLCYKLYFTLFKLGNIIEGQMS